MNEKMATKKTYFSPEIQAFKITEKDVIRTSNGTGAKMDWDGNWGSFGNAQGGAN